MQAQSHDPFVRPMSAESFSNLPFIVVTTLPLSPASQELTTFCGGEQMSRLRLTRPDLYLTKAKPKHRDGGTRKGSTLLLNGILTTLFSTDLSDEENVGV